jgi:xanthine/uracil permease
MASSPGQMSGNGGPAETGSVAGLLTRVMDDAMALARNEIALAKAEARGALQDLKQSLGPFAVAAGVMLAGALTLVAAVVLALAEVMRPWLAALVVAVALLIIGWVLLKAGQRKWANIGDRLDRTQESLQKDATVVARRT